MHDGVKCSWCSKEIEKGCFERIINEMSGIYEMQGICSSCYELRELAEYALEMQRKLIFKEN